MRNFDNKQMFDDVARLATGAVGALSGFRQHLQQEIKSHLDRFLIELDLVPRSDFEIVEQMAKQARTENEALKKRLDALEGKNGTKTTKPTPSAKAVLKSSTAKKAAGTKGQKR